MMMTPNPVGGTSIRIRSIGLGQDTLEMFQGLGLSMVSSKGGPRTERTLPWSYSHIGNVHRFRVEMFSCSGAPARHYANSRLERQFTSQSGSYSRRTLEGLGIPELPVVQDYDYGHFDLPGPE
jgi:hypothetical protein